MSQIKFCSTTSMIKEFSEAFGRPVNDRPTTPSVTDRLLLGNLLLEETLEYITKGLGLTVSMLPYDNASDGETLAHAGMPTRFELTHTEGDRYDPVEAADGLGDVNVIIHFNALWEGIPLAAVTNEIHRSNMSKLDSKGKPIINRCVKDDGMPGYPDCGEYRPGESCENPAHFIDPSKPKGKILKGPNYSPPNLLPILGIIPSEEEE